MLEVFTDVAAATDRRIPPEHHRGIGIVGAGAIVQVAHLPAYRAAGLPVLGITDLDPARAGELGGRFGVPAVSFEQLLADPAVEILDIAVNPNAQPALARRALQAGKHLLAQKPLALDLRTAQDLVELADRLGLRIVVNHQMRYGEGMAAARAMARLGWIGEVTAVLVDVHIATDWSAWPWLLESPTLDLMYHSIHYLDSIRALLGTPAEVFCATGRRPGQLAAGETRSLTTLLWEDGPRAHLNVNHENITGDAEARFRIDGTAGSIRGTIGLLYDYPHGRPDTVEVNSSVVPTDGWLPYPVTSRWIPDAFAGPMRALLAELAGGPVAPTTGGDAVQTLSLVQAAYRSAAEHRLVRLAAG